MDSEHGGEDSKYLVTLRESSGGSGSSKHSETHPEVFEGSTSSKHLEIHPYLIDGEAHVEASDGSSEHPETHSNVTDRTSSSKLSKTHSDVTEESGSFKHSSVHQEDAANEGNSSIHQQDGTNEDDSYIQDGANEGDSYIHRQDGANEGDASTHQGDGANEGDSSIHRQDGANEGDASTHQGDGANEGDSSIRRQDGADEDDPHTLAKRAGPFSSSDPSASASSMEDLFQADSNKVDKDAQIVFLPDTDKDTHRVLEDESEVSCDSSMSEEKDIGIPVPTSTTQVSDTTHELGMHGMLSAQFPQRQMMDRSEGYDPYRIPSSVFARSKSTTPLEWSVASNESLFSIQIGNQSFSRDHMLGFGELKPEDLNKSGELFMLSPPTPVPAAETDTQNFRKHKHDSGATILANERIKDAQRVSAESQSKEKFSLTPSRNSSTLSYQSDGSGISARSFAFPVLAEGEKGGPLETGGEKQHQQPQARKVTAMSATRYWFPCLYWRPWCCSYRCCC